MFPNWKHEQETINACRWVDDLINKTYIDIEKEFKTHESTSIQRQPLYGSSYRPNKKLGNNKKI